jgi:hypothetical protein
VLLLIGVGGVGGLLLVGVGGVGGVGGVSKETVRFRKVLKLSMETSSDSQNGSSPS